MILQTKAKKILPAGIHLVVVKHVSVVRNDKGEPASWVDPATGQHTGAIRVLFMGKDKYGIEHDFWLAQAHLKHVKAFTDALGIKKPPVPKEDVIGRKLFIMVYDVLFFDGKQPRFDANGKQVSIQRLAPRFWAAPGTPPTVPGNPQDNGGVASGDFLWHWTNEDGVGKYFQPNTETVQTKTFGE